jgi:endoglucanase
MQQYIRIREQLEKYSNAHGVSGREGSIKYLMEQDTNFGFKHMTDAMGNMIAIREGEPGYPSVLLDAHMDEIGFMVRGITPDGFLQFVGIGGHYPAIVIGQRVLIHAKANIMPGVVGSKPPHVMNQTERNAPIELDNLFIDAGFASDKEAKEAGVKIGTTITYATEMTSLRNDLVTGKAFDDRAGIVIVLEAVRRTNFKGTIYVVGSTQEEVGLKGSKTAAYGLDPDYAIVADTTIPADHPGGNSMKCPVKTGAGPVFTIADAEGRGIMVPLKLVAKAEEVSEKHHIPVQFEVGAGGTTNGTMIHLTKTGIPTAVVSVATRYIHSPVEVLSLADIDAAAEFIARYMEAL